MDAQAKALMNQARCDRCGARFRTQASAKKQLWNAVFEGGEIVGFLCPDCQTADESAEATINEATLDYYGPDERGRTVARPKEGES